MRQIRIHPCLWKIKKNVPVISPAGSLMKAEGEKNRMQKYCVRLQYFSAAVECDACPSEA
jgi:hypothetical protein